MPLYKSKKEIDEMLSQLNNRIIAYEFRNSQPGFGIDLFSAGCLAARLDYAGWIAQRDFLLRLKKKAGYK